MKIKHFIYLFRRYVNDHATEKEINELMRMVKSGKYDSWIKNRIDRNLTGDIKRLHENNLDMSEQKAGKLLLNILNVESKKTTKKITEHPSSMHYSYSGTSTSWKWVAAAVVIFIGFSILYTDWMISEGGEEVAMQEVITNRGERTNLILGDGSRVTLNSDSRLKIPVDYGQHSRTLTLEGEAFFEVEHNPGQPFRVYTGDHVYTEVLGTQFNVRSYKTEADKVDVVVAEGRVLLGSEDQNQPNSVEVGAGQKGVIGPAGAISVVAVNNAGMDNYLGWVNNRLVFTDQPLEEIIRELERWYDIEVTITEPALYQRRMSAIFEDDPLSEVLQVISHALQIDFIQEKRQVEFFQ
ncbi:MAG: FecR domain-containing protein [Balneolaceae bacterium]|nr:FecR domain-containing protein [Balneolaceae bacterium]